MTSTPRSAVALALALTVAPLAGQTPASTTRSYVETLASVRFDGREAGTEGERLAGDYIAAQFKRAGLKTAGSLTDYFQPFEFTAGSRDGGSRITVTGYANDAAARSWSLAAANTDGGGTPSAVRALSFS